jgi:SAM-dependent methyltransferase
MTATPNFNRVARIYRWAEYLALGPLLQRARTHFIPQLAPCRSALLLGDGDGRFLAALLRANPHIHAVALDGSRRMLHLLQRRCSFAGARLQTCQGTLPAALEDLPSPKNFDLVISHFVLDCFTQPDVERIVQAAAKAANPHTLWLISDFGLPSRPIRRRVAAIYIRALYAAFRLLTGLRVTSLPDPASELRRAGFTLQNRREWMSGFVYTEIWQRGSGPPPIAARVAANSSAMLTDSPSLSPTHPPQDAQPNPEPAVPSLPGPDPGVFHHEPTPAPAAPNLMNEGPEKTV